MFLASDQFHFTFFLFFYSLNCFLQLLDCQQLADLKAPQCRMQPSDHVESTSRLKFSMKELAFNVFW